MDKIKVLQINKLYYPAIGGIERVVQHIAEGLKDQVDMSVLVCQPKGPGSEDNINGVPVKRCSSIGIFFSMPISLSFLRELKRQAVGKDILQFHAPFPLGDLALLLSGYKGKVVLYWHSDVVKQKKLMLFYRPIMNRFLKRVDAIIVSADGVMNGSSYLEPYKAKCVTIPFAVNPDFEQKGRDYLRYAEKNKEQYAKFLFVGRLVYYKGVDVLLQAFSDVQNAELTIIGNGILEDELKCYTKEHNMTDRVHFLGKVDEDRLHREFAACDVFVLPSVAKSEAFGLVQQEAMSYGKPVINTNLPSGVPEVSLDGVTGLTVEPGDQTALYQAMQWIVDHPDKRIEFGQAARDRVDKNYTLGVMMRRMKQLYEIVLKGN